MLAYLSRYTHRVAISNQRLVALDERGVTFRWKDYRAKGRTRYKTMTLEAGEFKRFDQRGQKAGCDQLGSAIEQHGIGRAQRYEIGSLDDLLQAHVCIHLPKLWQNLIGQHKYARRSQQLARAPSGARVPSAA